MNTDLSGRKVAILVENGFELVELTAPRQALDEAGAETDLISPVDKEGQELGSHQMGQEFQSGCPPCGSARRQV